jgi:Mn-dependent DtxR family transcriptional regulator
MFNQLKIAFDVLADPARRSAYDNARRQHPRQPLSSTIDFMDDLEGELNRRVAVLALVYHRRRTSPNMPEVTLAQIEERMGFPRDYLDFTLWYLQKKGYVTKTDDAQYTLTAEGVDFVERERGKLPTLHRLLTGSSESSAGSSDQYGAEMAEPTSFHLLDTISMVPEAGGESAAPATSFPAEPTNKRRVEAQDRRVGAPDKRLIKVERRGHIKERRYEPMNRRKVN